MDHEDLWLAMGQPLELSAEEQAKGDEPKLRGAQEFMLWMHNPLTAAFFSFLADQETNYVEALTEFFIRGHIVDGSPTETQNPQVWRGRILALRDLQRITLGEIADFYRQKRGVIEG